MAIRWLIPIGLVLAVSLLVAQLRGQPDPASSPDPAPRVQETPEWATRLETVYKVEQGGDVRYMADESKQAIRIDALNRTGTMIGMTMENGCIAKSYYDFGCVYFADGSLLYLEDMVVEGWSGSHPALVSGTPL